MDHKALPGGLNHAPGTDESTRNNELHACRELLGVPVLVSENVDALKDVAVLLLRVLNLPFPDLAGPDTSAELSVRGFVLDPDCLLRVARDQLLFADVVDLRS